VTVLYLLTHLGAIIAFDLISAHCISIIYWEVIDTLLWVVLYVVCNLTQATYLMYLIYKYSNNRKGNEGAGWRKTFATQMNVQLIDIILIWVGRQCSESNKSAKRRTFSKYF
jgi:hypothetical protein